MKIKIKNILYWLSVVRPIADIVIGAVKGVIGAIQQAKSDEQFRKEKADFDSLDSLPFMSDIEGENDDRQ